MTLNNLCEYEGVSKADPLELLKHVGKVVEVRTIYNKSIKGTVITVDPITESYVLTNSADKDLSTTIILGHTVKSVNCLAEEPILVDFKNLSDTSGKNYKLQGKKLKEWLEKNLIPVVEEEGVLKIYDSLTIHPPYRCEDIMSNNEMVLHKILKIVDSMPSDI